VETAIAVLVMVLLIGLLGALVRRMRATRGVRILEDIPVGGPPEQVEPPLVAALSSIKGVQHVAVDRGQHTLVIRRIPLWVIIPLWVTFPVGLLFLLVKESVLLHVTLFDGPAGAVVRLAGTTEVRLLEQIRAAVASVHPDHTGAVRPP